ncbi:MAG: ABC transporter permease [Oscillospiraceae bacterium]|nr:ABC transporter permease [Oscillospiraceae bacterium]
MKKEKTAKKLDGAAVVKIAFRLSPVIGAIVGLIIAALFLLLWNVNPWQFFAELVTGALGSAKAIGNTLNRATPYMIIGVATAIAYECGSMNMGQEGQVFMGGLGAAIVALAFPNLPAIIAIPFALLGGMVFGALYISIPVIFRLTKGINEVLITLIMNYVATLIVSAMVIGPLACTGSSSYPHTDDFGAAYILTNWKNIGHLHAGIFIALVVVILGIYFFWVNPMGLRLRIAGFSPMASRTAGISPTKVFAIGMLLNGAFCGLAGGVELLGRYNNLRGSYADGIGWDSLIVALLAGLNPKGVLPAALFFGALYTGINSMQRTLGVPSALLSLIKGCIMVFIMTGTAIQKYHKFKAKKLEKKEV